jgi:hypothetical protein
VEEVGRVGGAGWLVVGWWVGEAGQFVCIAGWCKRQVVVLTFQSTPPQARSAPHHNSHTTTHLDERLDVGLPHILEQEQAAVRRGAGGAGAHQLAGVQLSVA